MSPEMQLAAQVAQLGIGTMMAFGMLGVVWYLLKVSIPALTLAHKESITELSTGHKADIVTLNANHLAVVNLVVDESKRSNEAICHRLETMESRIAAYSQDLAALRGKIST